MYEIFNVKSCIVRVDTIYAIRLFDDILFNAPVVFLILDALTFKIIDEKKWKLIYLRTCLRIFLIVLLMILMMNSDLNSDEKHALS
jgi:hypothetical protein